MFWYDFFVGSGILSPVRLFRDKRTIGETGSNPDFVRSVLQTPFLLPLLRYVTWEPNLRVKRSCTGLGNLEVFLFVLIVSKDYVLVRTLSHLLYDWSDVT
jgi:hypothetical protein